MSLTIDYGIDLGTTNSCIAVSEAGVPTVVRIGRADYIPSAVYRVGLPGSKEGVLTRVGMNAKSLLPQQETWGGGQDSQTDGPVALEFKRRMGERTWSHRFTRGGGQASAVELSAAVLRELIEEAALSQDEPIEAAVITCPSSFMQPQWDATREAALLAGLRQVELYEEPVAACLAYKMDRQTISSRWLVFDLGGGTFDCALAGVDAGMIRVLDHAGDNRLGGKDMDIALVDTCLRPLLPSHIADDVIRDHSSSWWRLRDAAESAKIELSKIAKTTTTIHVEGFPGDPGYALQYDLTREELNGIEKGVVDKAIRISKDLLDRNQFELRHIDRVVLVGGPTFSPYLRSEVGRQLGIPVDASLDPMTAVARGAAYYARSRRLTEARRLPSPSPGRRSVVVEINYQPVTPNKEPLITGKLLVSPATGWQIQLECVRTLWSSGRIAVQGNGAFQTVVPLADGENRVSIRVWNSQGQEVEPSEPEIRIVLGTAPPTSIPHSLGLGVVTSNGGVEWLFRPGESTSSGLRKKTGHFATTKSLKKGEKGQIVLIPICEGKEEKAYVNRVIGQITIKSEKITKDLPQGTPIDVEVEWNADNKKMNAHAWIDLLEYGDDMEKVCTDLSVDFPQLQNAMEEVERAVSYLDGIKEEDDAVSQCLSSVQSQDLMRVATRLVEQSERDLDDRQRAWEAITHVKVVIGPAWEKAEANSLWKWAEVHRKTEENVRQAFRILASSDHEKKNELQAGLEALLSEYVKAVEKRDVEGTELIAYGRVPDLLISSGVAKGVPVGHEETGVPQTGIIFVRESDVKKL
jgi:molecular chaperone DnaK